MSSSEQQQHLQRLHALAMANVMRSSRSRLKREIRAGAVTVTALLRDPPPEAEGCQLQELLISQRGWGWRRCMRFLTAHEISEHKLIRELTARQRELLARELETPAHHWSYDSVAAATQASRRAQSAGEKAQGLVG
jgi:hypothetical protein